MLEPLGHTKNGYGESRSTSGNGWGQRTTTSNQMKSRSSYARSCAMGGSSEGPLQQLRPPHERMGLLAEGHLPRVGEDQARSSPWPFNRRDGRRHSSILGGQQSLGMEGGESVVYIYTKDKLPLSTCKRNVFSSPRDKDSRPQECWRAKSNCKVRRYIARHGIAAIKVA